MLRGYQTTLSALNRHNALQFHTPCAGQCLRLAGPHVVCPWSGKKAGMQSDPCRNLLRLLLLLLPRLLLVLTCPH